jgi:hypothetical protein
MFKLWAFTPLVPRLHNKTSSGALRTVAWADGGANDICPAGFSVPTEAELTADTIGATTTNITNIDTVFSSFLKTNNCSALECYILSAGHAIYTKCLILNTTNTKAVSMINVAGSRSYLNDLSHFIRDLCTNRGD